MCVCVHIDLMLVWKEKIAQFLQSENYGLMSVTIVVAWRIGTWNSIAIGVICHRQSRVALMSDLDRTLDGIVVSDLWLTLDGTNTLFSFFNFVWEVSTRTKMDRSPYMDG
jgi:hypothetical protein